MKPEKENTEPNKAEEPTTDYAIPCLKKGVVDETFDFDAEFEKGYTTEEAKEIALQKIRAWWGK